MAYSNQENSEEIIQDQEPERKDSRKVIYGILIATLLGTWAYFIYDHYQNNQSIAGLTIQRDNADSVKNVVQTEYNTALARMDSLTGSNTQLQGALGQQKTEIDSLKAQIERIRRRDGGDLTKARGLIEQLNGKINDLTAQISTLQKQNNVLVATNQTLTTQRDSLTVQNKSVADSLQSTVAEKERITDEASTLHASDIAVAAADTKGNTTTKASKADVLRIAFTLDENRIASSGQKALYIIVTAPDGHVISMPSQGSGSFQTREDGQRVFTVLKSVDYIQGQSQRVAFNWSLGSHYQPGSYRVEVYHNGYKIGEGSATLKKSSFLGL